MSNKIPCTVSVLTFNNGKTLRECLDSVIDFAEIIVCDGGSTDNTLEIAREYDCKIIYQDAKFKYPNNRISDFAGVRNQSIEAAGYDWFFYVDSDEIISKDLVEEIREIVNKEDIAAYKIPRKYVLHDGRVVDRASTYPNYQVRLFHLTAVDGFIKKIHERIHVKEGFATKELTNVQFVPLDDIDSIVKKWDYYLSIQMEKVSEFEKWRMRRRMRVQLIKALKRMIKYFYVLLFERGVMMPWRYEYYSILLHFKMVRGLVKVYLDKAL